MLEARGTCILRSFELTWFILAWVVVDSCWARSDGERHVTEQVVFEFQESLHLSESNWCRFSPTICHVCPLVKRHLMVAM